MQVRAAQPQRVERHIGVAVRLDEVLELEARAREQLGQLALAKCLRVGIEPPRIGAELAIRLDRAELGALEHKAIGTLVTVTDRAAVHVDRAAALSRAGVDLMRTARRL